MEKNRISSFDGLRFIIVVFLAFHHFDCFNDFELPGWESVMKYLGEGYLSVNFFFMLSGFVISYNYSEKLKLEQITKKQFLLLRVAHIWPTYLIGLIIALLLYCGKHALNQIARLDFWCHFFMLQSVIPSTNIAFSYNGAAWSVSAEMFFYVIFLCIFQLSKKAKKCFTMALWGVIFLSITIVGLQADDANWLFYINPCFRLADFLTGVCIYDIYCNKTTSKLMQRRNASVLELVAVLVLAFTIFCGAMGHVSWIWKWQFFYTPAIFIIIIVFAKNRGFFSMVLGSRPMVFLGSISYPFYIIHQEILFLFKSTFIHSIHSSMDADGVGIMSIICSVVISIVIEYGFAKPLKRRLKDSILST